MPRAPLLALHAYSYCPLCLFSPVLYFYSFLLDAVLINYRVNIDLTVFLVYIWWQKRQKFLSFLHKSSPGRLFRSGLTDSWWYQGPSFPVSSFHPQDHHFWDAGQEEGSQTEKGILLGQIPFSNTLKSFTQHFTHNFLMRILTWPHLVASRLKKAFCLKW